MRYEHPFARFRMYVPGLLSVLMFLPLGMFLLDRNRAFEITRVIEVTWSGRDWQPDTTRRPFRNLMTFHIVGDKARDAVILDSTVLLLSHRARGFGTTRGIRLHFADTAKYESFVRALQICDSETGVKFIPHENDLWIWY